MITGNHRPEPPLPRQRCARYDPSRQTPICLIQTMPTRPATRMTLGLLIAAIMITLFSVSMAQEPDPADPLADPAVPEEEPLNAMIRVVNLVPNASDVDVSFQPLALADIEGKPAPEAISELQYQQRSSYQEIPARDHLVTVTASGTGELTDQAITLEEEISVDPDSYTTLVLRGLVLPPEAFEVEDEDEGFFAWLTGLFTGDDPGERDVLRLTLAERPHQPEHHAIYQHKHLADA